MNKWKSALLAVTLGAVALPGYAQVGGFDGLNFVKAVRERDSDTALDLLGKHGRTVVNARDNAGDTALTVAIARRDDVWTFYLLDKGADPNLPGRAGDTPLIAAARVGFYDAAEQLILRKAKVDGTNRMGETALIVAVQQHHKDIVKMLLEEGADPNKTDNAAGLSARDYAKRDTRNPELLAMIEANKPKPAIKKVEKVEDFKL